MNVDQQSLDFEPSALPRAAGVGRSVNGGQAKTSRRGFDALHGPHSCGGCGGVWMGGNTAHCSACHSTFATVGLFDAHRSIAGNCGTCRDPVTLIYRTGQHAGERVMHWREGLWQLPEMTSPEPVAAR